jgi:diacylglycerol kinase family enzyme
VVTRRLLVIANPIAGGGRARHLAPKLCSALQASGCVAELYLTQASGDAEVRARSACNEAFDAIIAVGGDGTVNEVLNGMPDPSQPLGVLPVGTANVLALELRLPKSLAAAAQVIAKGRTQRHAIGIANGRRFLLFCGAGVDGAVVQRMHELHSRTLGKLKWLSPILHTVRHWPRFTLRATLADGEVLDGLSSVLVTRVRNYGGVVQLPRGIDPQQDTLFVLGFRQRGRLAWLTQGSLGLIRCMHPSRNLLLRKTHALHIDSTAPYQIDGDFGGVGTLTIQQNASAANLIVP